MVGAGGERAFEKRSSDAARGTHDGRDACLPVAGRAAGRRGMPRLARHCLWLRAVTQRMARAPDLDGMRPRRCVCAQTWIGACVCVCVWLNESRQCETRRVDCALRGGALSIYASEYRERRGRRRVSCICAHQPCDIFLPSVTIDTKNSENTHSIGFSERRRDKSSVHTVALA